MIQFVEKVWFLPLLPLYLSLRRPLGMRQAEDKRQGKCAQWFALPFLSPSLIRPYMPQSVTPLAGLSEVAC